ncbi:hybrid sensor histidine kinase/response regulator [Nostoc sp. UHCC 0302]|uniref:hybrid sensor histidine kinase/response regulator n=1 Tax=Nostoc sp. UHCC 0302 TaxID=3134896 RepID=UPI00311CC6BB
MITDTTIREQGYIYFLAEVPELMQTIEQELFSLLEGYSINKVHNLMRATHTIKGSAANVGLEIIKKIAHSLEDAFKALYNPDVVIDSELQTILLQAYECLSLALNTELIGSTVNHEELLQRATSVFAQLQEKLGDAFGNETHIPSSAELGFDIVQSIFEMGVQQRLENLVEAINNIIDNTEFVNFLRDQAEVFLGLAESLNLPGLGEIAQAIIAALQVNSTEVQQIAEIAFANLKQAQKRVLAGDRTCGGEVSPALKKLANLSSNGLSEEIQNNSLAATFSSNKEKFYYFLTTSGDANNEPVKPTNAKFYLKILNYIFGWFNHQMGTSKEKLSLDLLIPILEENIILNYIEDWLKKFTDFIQNEKDSQSLRLYRQGIILIILVAVAKFQYSINKNNSYILVIQTLQTQIRTLAKEYKNYPPVTAQEKNWFNSQNLQPLLVIKEISNTESLLTVDSLLDTIWGGDVSANITEEASIIQSDKQITSDVSSAISLSKDEQDALDISETVIQAVPNSVIQINKKLEDNSQTFQTQNSRQHSFVRVDTEGLQRLNYLAGELLIYQKRRNLYDEQFQEIFEQLLQQLSRHQATLNQLRDLPLQMQNFTSQNTQNFTSVKFDSLEMDVYSEFNLTLHEAIEETFQLQETTESLDLLFTQATQISDKKQNLTLNIIDNLVEARMLPLENILNRFPQMVKKLGNVYAKLVELKLTGTEVLVDKAIAEKLYDPLLHLVRNAFDHGIEPPQVRQQLGKSEQGLIEICAYHQGGQTIIEVRDDGQGLNLEMVRRKAIELKLISADDEARGYYYQPLESELLDMIFLPGFSTASKVSEISGRGMGLDIVRSQLQVLNGSISVKSLPNQGTTFILKIPFSMTTDKLMLIQAGGVVYGLLLDTIEKILIPSEQQTKEFEGKKVLHYNTGRDETIVSLRQLSELMDYNSLFINNTNLNNISNTRDTEATKNPVLLLRRNQGIFALEVDQIIGEQELVIRPLGNAIAPPKYIYGCSSLANGNLILVIDAALLSEPTEMQATLDIMTLPAAYSSKKKALPMSEDTFISTPLLAASTAKTFVETQPSQFLVNHQTPKTVLVVDDAISLRQTLTLTLQKSGYQVIQAQNGVEALEKLHLHPEIKVIVSDLEMPRMNGFEFLNHLRQYPILAKIPVVILTSRSAEKHRQLAQELGAKAYLSKPYLEHEFLSIIKSLINSTIDEISNLTIVANHES